jgi:YbbR domain-containing protein
MKRKVKSERRSIWMVLIFAFLFALMAFVCIECVSEETPPDIEWVKTFGGSCGEDR